MQLLIKRRMMKKMASLINHLAIANIADACKGLNSWLIYVSTDYVFDGTATKPYGEEDKTNSQSIYGELKLNRELVIQRSGCKHKLYERHGFLVNMVITF